MTTDDSARPFKAGFVALAGLPNVGKSTLLNALIGERLAPVTRKAQTTRRNLRGIFTDEHHQAVFVDTPGILEPRDLLQHSMREQALSTLTDVDVVVTVAALTAPPSIVWAVRTVSKLTKTPAVLCLNKRDRVPRQRVEKVVSELDHEEWLSIHVVRADTGGGVQALRRDVLRALPESPPLFPEDDLSDASIRDLVGELIREACLESLSQEVPHATAVVVEEFREGREEQPTFISANIFAERDSQKRILVGSGGRMVRKIGMRARRKIEPLVGGRVYLELKVKILRDWRRRASGLRALGFPVPRSAD